MIFITDVQKMNNLNRKDAYKFISFADYAKGTQ